jgi:2-polyprenyl-3-methyl-5-hydroxy-6-metoxy-1,4-benzoquinol methylase
VTGPSVERLGFTGPFAPISRALTALLEDFAREEPAVLAGYLAGRHSLEPVTRALVRSLARHDPRLEPGLLLRFFEQHDARADRWIRERLAARGFQREVSLLGFGLGEGATERKLAGWLVEAGLAERVHLWGFDAHQVAGGEVRMLRREDLNGEEGPRFDIVTANYVLHHVQPGDRWADLLACLRRCSPGATVLFAEQGYPAPTRDSPPEARRAELALLAFDVLANATVHPGWCEIHADGEAPDFFVSYLSKAELGALEQRMPSVARREVEDVGPAFPGNILMHYTLA